MKSLLIISFLFFSTASVVYCQDLTDINDIKNYFFDLPLNSDKDAIIAAAKNKFKNNRIDSFVIQSNTKLYFEDTTVTYNYFTKKPVVTTLKIYELWNYDNPQNGDTTLYIIIDASFGTDKKAEKKMYRQYNNLVSKFEGRFVSQKPYSYFAEGKIGEGLNFLFNENDNNPVYNIGWSNGGCFPDYHVAVSFRRK